MDKAISDKVFAYIDALAEKLGVATDMVLKVMTKQQFIEGILGIGQTIIVYILAIILFAKIYPAASRKMHESIEKNERLDYYDFPHIIIPLAVVSIFAVVVLGVMTFSTLPTSINRLINPQYFVIQEILSAFK